MRTLMTTLLLAIASVAPLQAAEEVESPQAAALANAERIELGDGVSLPRPVFEQLMAREDGLEMIERMERRAKDATTFEGVPHLIVIFVGVLLFFWSALLYYQRKHARLHKTIQLMVEKGLPVPVEILRAAENAEANGDGTASVAAAPPMWASNLLWGGILWLTVGATGILFLWLRHSDAWPWGFAAVVYGLASIFTALRKQDAH
jgi:hypothetical protein